MKNALKIATILSGGGGGPATVTITSAEIGITAASPFEITVTFSKAVTGFVVGDITVGNGTADNLAGSGAVYTADITPTGDGTVTVQIAEGAVGNEASNVFSIIYLASAEIFALADYGTYTDAGKTIAAGHNDLVYTWDNLIGAEDGVSATEADRPIKKVVGGFHTLYFEGSATDKILFTDTADDASQSWFIVFKSDRATDAITRRVLSRDESTTASIYFKNNLTPAGFGYGTNQAGSGQGGLGGTATDWNVISIVFTDASNAHIRLNGGVAVDFDPSDTYSTQNGIQIGKSYLQGHVKAVLKCSAALADTPRAAVEAYFAALVANPT